MANRLTENQLHLSAEWLSKTVTTDPPKLVPHQEWRLVVHLGSDLPFRVAVMMYMPNLMEWGLRPEAATGSMDVSLDFFPYDWSSDDRVQINWGWRRVTVTDPDLKADPRPHTNLLLPAVATTGQPIPVSEVQRHSVRVAVCAIADPDTERRRHQRWRVRPQVAKELPRDLLPLGSGYQTGVVRTQAERRETKV